MRYMIISPGAEPGRAAGQGRVGLLSASLPAVREKRKRNDREKWARDREKGEASGK